MAADGRFTQPRLRDDQRTTSRATSPLVGAKESDETAEVAIRPATRKDPKVVCILAMYSKKAGQQLKSDRGQIEKRKGRSELKAPGLQAAWTSEDGLVGGRRKEMC